MSSVPLEHWKPSVPFMRNVGADLHSSCTKIGRMKFAAVSLQEQATFSIRRAVIIERAWFPRTYFAVLACGDFVWAWQSSESMACDAENHKISQSVHLTISICASF